MTSVIYAVILAFLICFLALNVIRMRRKHKIRYDDGGVAELQRARAAHSNATEYIPIAILLLLVLEYNGAPLWLVHVLGVIFVIGRIIHCRALLTEELRFRVIGMQITIVTIAVLAMLNIIYYPLALF